MPELPELEVLKDKLLSQIRGKTIMRLLILKPYVLKNYFTGDLSGKVIKDIERRGKYLIVRLTGYDLYIHLMRKGLLGYRLPGAKPRRTAAAVLEFDDGAVLEMSETGHKKRMALHILAFGQTLAKIDRLGPEPLTPDFDMAGLKDMLRGDRQQVKSFLCDQRKIAGIGNAYADEILWTAGLSPFRSTTDLDDGEIEKLYKAIITVLEWARAEVAKASPTEKRKFLRVHNKEGRPCPRCGGEILSISFSDHQTFYCPTCQTGGKRLKDRRMSKFYR